jgi:hypothetical protein
VTENDVRDEWRAPLDDLRTLRESLREEEQRTSYWRQLVQAGSTSSAPRSRAATPSADDLAGREGLWDTPIPWDDPPALHRLERGLIEARSSCPPTAGPCSCGDGRRHSVAYGG